jgi:sec-independent protein translocase protein TatB
MFDIGFWELVLIAVMALLILGPERLPVAIRTVRQWLTSARQFSHSIKSELNEELRVHELHANLKKAEQSNLQDLSPEVADSLKTLQEAAASVNEPFKKQLEVNNDAESFVEKPTMIEDADDNYAQGIINKNDNDKLCK